MLNFIGFVLFKNDLKFRGSALGVRVCACVRVCERVCARVSRIVLSVLVNFTLLALGWAE